MDTNDIIKALSKNVNQCGEAPHLESPIAALVNNNQTVAQQFFDSKRTIDNVDAIVNFIMLGKYISMFMDCIVDSCKTFTYDKTHDLVQKHENSVTNCTNFEGYPRGSSHDA